MKNFALILLTFYALGSLAQTKKESQGPVIFSIDKKPTYAQEFIYLFKKNHPNAQQYTEAQVDDYLNLFINFKLKINEAHARGYDTTAKFNQELKTYQEELKRPYRAEKDLLEKLTREAYNHLTQEVKASHILIQLKPEAQPADTLKAYEKISDIRKRAMGGEDFEKLARQWSDDPSAQSNGGHLGYFTALQMVYPFEAAAYKVNVGEISPIVRTRFGYHLIKVEDKKESRGEVEVSHILLRTTPGNEAKVKNLIFEIYDQLKSGRKWDDLCKEYSEDTNTKNVGGRLRPFGVGVFASVPEFEAMAFALQKPGEVSDPFQSNLGWHIIRLEKKIPLPPFAEAEPELKKKVARNERMKFSEQEAVENRKKELGLTENVDNEKIILALADSALIQGKWNFKGDEKLKKLKLISFAETIFTAADFFAWVEKYQRPNRHSPAQYMQQLYSAFVSEKTDEVENDKIIKQNPDFRHLMAEYREGILLFEVMEKEIWNKASEDTLGQKKFYQQNSAAYKAGPRVEARIFSTTDKSFLDKIVQKVSNHDSLTAADLKKFKSVQHFRNYEKGESKAVDKIDWVPGAHQTEVEGTYYLVEVARLVAPGTKSFAEVRAQVISGYQDYLEKEWVTSLKKKYKVKVNDKGKKTVWNELLKK
ncbi:MAG: peptidylprolyl isomerase [Bacteroidetes bacterium]|nr:peptidylprolyl isomerase [Bacteroidota bacterium]